MLGFLSFLFTAAIAVATSYIAIAANRIANRSIRVDADKHVFEWGQRALSCLSAVSALRLTPKAEISDEEFRKERRLLRASLFALAEEGALFFAKADAEATDASGALMALQKVTDCTNGRMFKSPHDLDDDTRLKQNKEIRSHTRAFIKSIQDHVGSEWIR